MSKCKSRDEHGTNLTTSSGADCSGQGTPRNKCGTKPPTIPNEICSGKVAPRMGPARHRAATLNAGACLTYVNCLWVMVSSKVLNERFGMISRFTSSLKDKRYQLVPKESIELAPFPPGVPCNMVWQPPPLAVRYQRNMVQQ